MDESQAQPPSFLFGDPIFVFFYRLFADHLFYVDQASTKKNESTSNHDG
jgi:hypothetical protein